MSASSSPWFASNAGWILGRRRPLRLALLYTRRERRAEQAAHLAEPGAAARALLGDRRRGGAVDREPAGRAVEVGHLSSKAAGGRPTVAQTGGSVNGNRY